MIKVLILEDNLKALKAIMEGLSELESALGQIAVTVFSEGELTERFLKNLAVDKFDVVLLDYLSGDDKNFHQAILGRINPEKIIAISNTDAYNQMAEDQEVSRIVRKDYSDLANFKNKFKEAIKNILNFK